MGKPESCRACPGFEWDGYMARADGSSRSGVALIGEALGENEAAEGRPFVGKAGGWLTSLLRRNGLNREDFLIDNVVRCRPPENRIALAEDNGALSLCPSQPNHLHSTLRDPRIRVVVPMGATALRSVLTLHPDTPLGPYLGYPQWSFEWSKWVLPTWHPAFLFRGNQRLSGVFAQHIAKAAKIARGELVPGGLPSTLSDPALVEAEAWVGQFEARLKSGLPTWLAFDIETPYKASGEGEDEGELIMDDPSYTILRIGFAFQGSPGLSLAWRADYIPLMQRLLAAACPKVAHNGRYDVPRVLANGLSIGGDVWDSMWAWHVINSDLDKGLGFVAPLLLNIPRWKHLGGTNPGVYNAVDAVVTLQIMEIIERDLRANQLWSVFDRHVVQIDRVLTLMHQTGIQLDQAKRREVSENLIQELHEKAQTLDSLVPLAAKALHPKAGYKKEPKSLEGLVPLPPVPSPVKFCPGCGEVSPRKEHFKKYVKKDNPCGGLVPSVRSIPTVRWARPVPFVPSNIRLQAYQDAVDHKPIRKRDKKSGKVRPTFDDDALKALGIAHPEDLVYPQVQSYRGTEKQLGYVGAWVDGRWDGGMPQDGAGRVHTIIGHTPSTLRFSSVTPNLQNQPKDGPIRSLFVPNPGMRLLEVDYSAIESVLTGYLCPSPEFVRLAKSGVHDYLNSHILARAGRIARPAELGWPDADLVPFLKDLKRRFPAEREIAKRVCHGTTYGMSGREMFRKYPEVFGDEKNAASLRSLYYEVCPMIPRWQEATVVRAEEEGSLRNPFGYLHRFWHVCDYKMGPDGEWSRKWAEDAKRAIAFMPQSTAAGIIKEAMLALEQEYGMASRGWLLLQIHDSLLFQFPEAEFDSLAAIVVEVMTRPIKQLPLPWDPSQLLTIGVEAKHGERWGKDMKLWQN